MKQFYRFLPPLSLLPLFVFAMCAVAHAQGVLVPEPDARGAANAGHGASSATAGDEQWSDSIGPVNAGGMVYVVATAPNGDIYIGGDFTAIAGTTANRIARWNGSSWSALGTGIPAGAVYAIAFLGNDVIVGGRFKGAGDVKTSNIARWNGTAWTAFGDITNEGLDSSVMAIAVRGNDFFAGGNFTYSGTQDEMNFITKWDAGLKLFISLDDGVHRGMDGGVASLLMVGGNLYVAGGFTKGGGEYASRIATWNDTAWSSLGGGLALQGGVPYVASIAAHDTSIYVAGSFALAGGKPMKNIAQWSMPSSAWYTVGRSGGLDSAASCVTVDDDGDVYVGGRFTKAGGTSASSIAKWTSAGGWAPLGSGLNGPATSLAVAGPYLWVGGAFTTAGGKPSPSLARWTRAGSITGVDDRAGLDASALHAVVQPNPLNGIGTFHLILPSACTPRIAIVDCRGTEITTVEPGSYAAGEHAIPFDASSLASGIYFCRAVCGRAVITTRFVVMR